MDNLPPDDAAEKVERWASMGSGIKAIARGLNVSYETLKIWMKRHPELQDALDAGREAEHQMLYQALLKHLDTSPTPAIFLLKTRHGYREGDQKDQANTVSINFSLPGAQDLETYKTIIEHQPRKIEHEQPND